MTKKNKNKVVSPPTPKVSANIVAKKEFYYSIEDVSLSYTLLVEDKHQLINFRKLLIEAIKDIENILKINDQAN